MVLVKPYPKQHSAQCPPVDPRSTTPLDCGQCEAARIRPPWINGEERVTCGSCGAEDVPTSGDPRFAGYAGGHSRPEDWRSSCHGQYLAHGRPTAERSPEPGWVPVAHVRPGDVICPRDSYSGKWGEPTVVVYARPGETQEGSGIPRISLGWLSADPSHAAGTWGMWAAPGTPVLLVQAAISAPPPAHRNVRFFNAISSRSRAYSRCYRTEAEADAGIREFRPYNNTGWEMRECWRAECLPNSE